MRRRISVDELAIIVAEDFIEGIKFADCEGFREMKELYDWGSADIRGEVEATIHASETDWEMLDDADVYHFAADGCGTDECVPYRTFINKVYKVMKKRSLY